MSTTRVFIFVEGRDTDVFFYSEITRPICEAVGLDWDIVRADRVSAAGGKEGLLTLYRFLEANGSLIDRSKGTESWCLFYLDKDVDDILGNLVRSPHIVYTPHYTVENALFLHADLIRAMAAASSLNAQRLARRIPDKTTWARQKAAAWKEFVALCLFAAKYGAHTDCTYGCSSSPLHENGGGTLAERVQARKNELQQHSNLTPQQIERKFRASLRMIDRIYRKNQHDSVFNGKWYLGLLMKEIELAAQGDHYSAHGLKNGLVAAMKATLNFDDAWTEHFRAPLRQLIS